MLRPGQRLDDYQIINYFEGGGMGEIYLAEEVSLGRQVVIKIVRPEAIKYPDSEEAQKVKQLFRREATAIAKLNHPYILPLYRFGESTIDTIPMMYMVMPYCQENSLTDWMHAHGKTILSPQEAECPERPADGRCAVNDIRSTNAVSPTYFSEYSGVIFWKLSILDGQFIQPNVAKYNLAKSAEFRRNMYSEWHCFLYCERDG